MSDIQRMMDALSDAMRTGRSGYHLTLGKLIDTLAENPAEMIVRFDHGRFVGKPNSFRGYYSDLAFDSSSHESTVGALSRTAENALGDTFEGYKGGEFVMSENTPLWNASYGVEGPAIIDAVVMDGTLVLITKEIE